MSHTKTRLNCSIIESNIKITKDEMKSTKSKRQKEREKEREGRREGEREKGRKKRVMKYF
jgi:hypothetical protein